MNTALRLQHATNGECILLWTSRIFIYSSSDKIPFEIYITTVFCSNKMAYIFKKKLLVTLHNSQVLLTSKSEFHSKQAGRCSVQTNPLRSFVLYCIIIRHNLQPFVFVLFHKMKWLDRGKWLYIANSS
jgi:hypothetical protein